MGRFRGGRVGLGVEMGRFRGGDGQRERETRGG